MAIDPGTVCDRHVFYHRAKGTALSLSIQLDKVYVCTLVPRVLTKLYTYLGKAHIDCSQR